MPAPSEKTRVAILRKKAAFEHVALPDDVAFLVAGRIKANIREIEGSLTRTIAFCKLSGREMTGRGRGPGRAMAPTPEGSIAAACRRAEPGACIAAGFGCAPSGPDPSVPTLARIADCETLDERWPRAEEMIWRVAFVCPAAGRRSGG